MRNVILVINNFKNNLKKRDLILNQKIKRLKLINKLVIFIYLRKKVILKKTNQKEVNRVHKESLSYLNPKVKMEMIKI